MVLLTPAFAPTWALFIGIVLILIADILFREKAKEYIVIISTLTLVASAALTRLVAYQPVSYTHLTLPTTSRV